MTSARSSNGSGKTIRASIRSNPAWTQRGGSPAPTAREAPNHLLRRAVVWCLVLGIWSLFRFPRPKNRPPRFRACVLAILEDLRAVHEHVLHAYSVLMRLVERRAISHRRRIENHDIGEHALLHETAMIQTQIRRRQPAQLPDRLLQRQHFFFAHILPEDAREAAVSARVTVRFQEVPFRRLRRFVRAE